ncbi:Uncharacterised protein [Mycobacteroides abscessus subsp. massiliense]|nr:Uncharacterised protein [Mycobacteroides abscessus subsp. massiliense]
MFIGDDQRWRQPQHIGCGGVDEEPGLARGRLGGLGALLRQDDAEKQSRTAHPIDQRMVEFFNGMTQ